MTKTFPKKQTGCVRSSGTSQPIAVREWPEGYVESFADVPDDFERPAQGNVENDATPSTAPPTASDPPDRRTPASRRSSPDVGGPASASGLRPQPPRSGPARRGGRSGGRLCGAR